MMNYAPKPVIVPLELRQMKPRIYQLKATN